MLIETKKKKAQDEDKDRIVCGRCKCEFSPRENEETKELDCSCPMCGAGKFKESLGQSGKMILND
jgi:uncharacterized CHY-type Zn-finger protein